MSQSDNKSDASNTTSSETEVYELIIDLCKSEMQILLAGMIKSASSFANWKLSESDSSHLSSQLKDKRRVIQAAFAFQLEKGFSDFKDSGEALSRGKETDSQKIFQLIGASSSTDIEEIETQLQKLEHLYKNFYKTLTKRLQSCLDLTSLASWICRMSRSS